MSDTRILAITGASGSGKSTLAEALVSACNGGAGAANACLLSLDAYYRDLSHLSMAARERVDFDHPDAIEFPLFAQHLEALKAGQSVSVPRYDFSSHTRILEQSDQVGPARTVVADGVLLGAWSDLQEAVDGIIFVDTPLEQCLQRRLARDCGERGRTESSVRDFWHTRALPAFQSWGDRVKAEAHLVVSGVEPIESSVATVRGAFAL